MKITVYDKKMGLCQLLKTRVRSQFMKNWSFKVRFKFLRIGLGSWFYIKRASCIQIGRNRELCSEKTKNNNSLKSIEIIVLTSTSLPAERPSWDGVGSVICSKPAFLSTVLTRYCSSHNGLCFAFLLFKMIPNRTGWMQAKN